MVHYRRNFLPGGTFFFTVTLEDRSSSLLVDHIELLRAAFRAARGKKPFTVDAIVILPEHLHAVMTLPSGDADFSDRWRQIKSYFTRGLVAAGAPLSANHRGEYALWQRRFWEHTVRNERDFERCVDNIHYNPAKHRLASSPGTGRTRRFIDTSARVYCRPIGAATERQTTTTLASGRTDLDFASLHPGYKTGALDRNPSSAIPALHGRCGRRIRCSRRHIGGYPRASAPARGWRARRGSAGRGTRTASYPRTRRAH